MNFRFSRHEYAPWLWRLDDRNVPQTGPSDLRHIPPGSRWFRNTAAYAESRIRRLRPSSAASVAVDVCSARPIVDITPALRGLIKIAAFARSITVPDMLRDLLARQFPDTDEATRESRSNTARATS